jgi:hypothetical protein
MQSHKHDNQCVTQLRFLELQSVPGDNGSFVLMSQQNIFCNIWGFHGGDYCYAVWLL